MVMINKQFDMPALNKMAQDYAIESDRMEMMEGMTDDVSWHVLTPHKHHNAHKPQHTRHKLP